jgi:uncharacterized repeat protein (TIGR03803 family)
MKGNQNPFWTAVSKALAVLTVTLIAALVLAPRAQAADAYKTLYKFHSVEGPSEPEATLVFDASGNLYGATVDGGQYGSGGVYKLAPNADGSWTETELYSFTGGSDGSLPNSAVIFDASGNLYSSTFTGGEYRYGVVYELTPNSDGTWTESVLYSFTGGSDGALPGMGEIFDAAGNLYGTTRDGGAYGRGVVFELTPNSNGTWTENVLYSFRGHKDGATPCFGNLIFDAAGNLYGTTGGWDGGSNGTVFELTPNSNGTWTESVLHSFRGGKDGSRAVGALTFDQAGNLYGATYSGGTYGEGTVFKLTPGSNGKWTKDVIHQFRGKTSGDGSNPYAGVIFDPAGNLHGTTYDGGSGPCSYQGPGCGTVFKLVPNSKGGWTEQILHRFNSYAASSPVGAVVMDAAGNLYAATSNEGGNKNGTVFEITP